MSVVLRKLPPGNNSERTGAANPHWKGGKYAKPKIAARDKARHAKHRGKLKPKPCERCGATDRVQMHHEDYAEPLEVRWLCDPCHRKLHGPQAVGKKHGLSKLTESQVLEIRAKASTGIRVAELVRRFGVNRTSVVRIIKRATWKHI